MRALRQQKGLRQADLAGGRVTVAYVSMVEAGKRTPGLEVLTHLADRLGCTVGELKGGPSQDDLASWRLAADYAELALHNGEAADALARAESMLESMLESVARVGAGEVDPDLVWRGRWVRARALEAGGDLDAAVAELAALHEWTSTDGPQPHDPVKAMNISVAWSRCLTLTRDVSGAMRVVQQARAAAEALGLQGTDGYAELTSKLMALHYMRNDIEAAAQVAEELIGLVEATGSRRSRGAAYWNAAGVAEARGDLPGAVALSERAVAMLAEDADERMLARARTACAWFMLRADTHRAGEALDLLTKARAALEVSGSTTDLAYVHVETGQALVLLQRPAEALVEADTALELLGADPQPETPSAWLVRTAALTALGDTDRAQSSATRAEAALRALPPTRFVALGFRELGQVHEALGNSDLALAAYRTALDLTATTPMPSTEERPGAPEARTAVREVRRPG